MSNAPGPNESALAQAIQRVSSDTRGLIQDQVDLAKLELQQKATVFGRGTVIAIAAGVFLIGALLLILLLGVILWRAIVIAYRADDLYGRLVCTGVIAWFAFQLFENIGMTLGIMPITGIPLPLVSSGGTSMMAVWIGIGLLQNVRLHPVRNSP